MVWYLLSVSVIASNKLGGTLPSELGRLTELTSLVLGKLFVIADNQFDGTVPSELGRLTQLTYLSLGMCFCIILYYNVVVF